VDVKRLEGKAAIVTGGGRGIGRAVALAYAHEGAAVVVASRTPREVDQVAAEAALEGVQAQAFACDATDEDAVARLVDGALAALGRCDVLVNAAGIAGPVAAVADLGLGEWEAGIHGNLRPAFLCCRAVIPHMRRQGGGKILNVASGLAAHPLPGVSAYGASKAAIVQFSRILAVEERSNGLQVFAVQPGVVRTAVLEDLFGAGDPRAPATTRGRIQRLEAAGHLRSPEDSARLFVYLAAGPVDDLAGQFVRIDDPAIQSRLSGFFSA
jgi:3-oxoacyl-[acyl-carrier protein] reductase